MSVLNEIGLNLAILIPYVLLTVLVDRWIQHRSDAIVSGVVRGVTVSVKHRWSLLYMRLLPNIVVGILFHGMMALGWLIVASNMSSEEVRRFSYLMAFFASGGFALWLLLAPLWFLHLASVLRR
ncbi:MAG: hypothetical protein JSW51_10955, partial [Gemmatimonadota bacterium]